MNKELDKSTGKKSKCFKTGSEIVSSINNFVIRLRHFNCGITFVMQNIGDFDTREEDDFSASVLNNAYSVAIFTNEDIPDNFAKSFGLIDDEVEHIGSSVRRQQRPGRGEVSQCLLVQKDKRFRLDVEGLPLESELITTNPEELRARKEVQINEIERKR